MNPIGGTDDNCPFCGSSISVNVPPHHLAPGTVLNNKFLVGAAIGEGGFGITYIGRDIKLDMKVAIKEYYPSGYANRSNTISPTVSSSSSEERKDFFDMGKERFLKEAQSLAKFSGSAGIVDVRDFFEENNTAYIVMEYLDGQTLKNYLRSNGTLTPEQTVKLLMPVMESLKKVHSQGIIHRDISPDNIMLVGKRVKLLDFGAARYVSATNNKSLSVILKPGYAPEEQYRSKGNQGPWTDIYALCATMYKCITGITPDDSTQRVFNDELKTPSELGINIDPAIEKALIKGLSVMQKDRYQNIDELLDGLNDIKLTSVDDSKTVSNGIPVIEKDKTVIGNRDVTVYEPTYGSNTTASDTDSNKPISKPKNEKNKNRKVGIILMSAVLAIIAFVGIFTIVNALSSTTIGGEKVKKNDIFLHVSDTTVTDKDMKAIASMGKLKRLYFSNCIIDNDTIKCLRNISAPVTELGLSNCSGFDDYSSISDLQYLQQLDITDCGLTDKQLEKIKFDNKKYLKYVDFSGNESLSDLSPLSSVKLLCEITVDNTSVCDFSALKNCEALQTVSANGCKIKDISTLTNKAIITLCLNNNEISDISSFVNFEALNDLEISNNKISDISPLTNATNLISLQISDNQVASLQPLSGAKQLIHLYINRNKLTNLDGLENALELKYLEASENQLEDINGIANSSVLEEFNINSNSVSDISLLGKSSETLRKVFFNNNNVSDISCLANTSNLEYLSFDYNKVTTLDSLKNSTALLGISADTNEISSIDGLSNSTKLKYIYLPHNKITDMTPVYNLVSHNSDTLTAIDLSSNQITELKAVPGKTYGYLAVYNNPIKSFSNISEIKGSYFLLSYTDEIDFAEFKGTFKYYSIIDCPKDKQVKTKNAVYDNELNASLYISFSTVEEADKQIRDTKNNILSGFTMPIEDDA